jgi:uncharacterized linocin/CFP29 family protein
MDLIINGAAYGSVAQRLQASGMNVTALRPWLEADGRAFINLNNTPSLATNATLRKDEWKQYDEAILKAAQNRLVGVADLERRGLVYTIGNGLGKTVLEYEDVGDINEAEVSMDGARRSKGDAPDFSIKYLPLPLVYKDFDINARTLAASRTTGDPLDTTMGQLAGIKVADKIENILFNGLTVGGTNFTFGGGTLYGYSNHPNRNTYTLTAGWNLSAATGATILADVNAMKQALLADKKFGPYVLYIPAAYETVLDEDYTSGYPKTIRQRLLEIGNLSEIKVIDNLTVGNVLLVSMSIETVRLVKGMDITPVEWTSEGNMLHHFKVMAIQIPQIRADQDGKCGVCHGSV